MNLLLRMIRVVVAALLGRRLDILAESVLHFRVWPNDLDVNLHMNNGRYLTVMDLGRTDLMIRCGLAGPTVRNRWMPVLGATSVRFRRSLGPFRRYRLRSRLLCWDEKWLYIEHLVETPDGGLACRAVVKGLFRARGGNVSPAELLAAAGVPRLPSPPMPASVAAWIAAEEAMARRAAA